MLHTGGMLFGLGDVDVGQRPPVSQPWPRQLGLVGRDEVAEARCRGQSAGQRRSQRGRWLDRGQ